MTALTLLAEVAAAGVHIRVVGVDLALRPKGVLPPDLRARLVASKSQVRILLDPEVRWRVEVMHAQVPPWPAPVLSLLARSDIHRDVDDCFSCGDPLEPMSLTPVPRRCRPCRQAAWLVLEDWPPAGPSGAQPGGVRVAARADVLVVEQECGARRSEGGGVTHTKPRRRVKRRKRAR